MARLTAEAEAFARSQISDDRGSLNKFYGDMLFAEIDALRAERDAAKAGWDESEAQWDADLDQAVEPVLAARDEIKAALAELVRLKEARDHAPEEYTLEAKQAAWMTAYRLAGVKHRHEPPEQECGI